ncbi:MAG: hypothetical protein ABI680_18480 [Chthoniobacteraceae bacterium]
MDPGTVLTRASVWLALIAYAIAASLLLLGRGVRDGLSTTIVKWIWTGGCLFFLLHVGSAFAFFHHWSHDAAYRDTANQTAEMTGLRWGGGLYLNYFFAAAWVADVLAMWMTPLAQTRRARGLTMAWHIFFFFMVFNGAVVFAHGPVRWLGLAICGTLAAISFWTRMAVRNPRSK